MMDDDVATIPGRSLAGLDKPDWLSAVVDFSEEHGYFQPLGKYHFASFIDHGTTLLVTFETISSMRADDGESLGWHMVRDAGWSHLCIASDGDTWFRDPKIYGYFDRLVDDGFFEDFDHVLFYGAGACGYAASAFSVAAPGAAVLAVTPQATLDPDVAPWETRFDGMRRVSFTDRYGYAPDMIDAADRAYVIYDPAQTLDAMHGALFRRPNVTRFQLRRMGGALEKDLIDMKILHRLMELAATGRLTRPCFARLARTRRTHLPYLRALLGELESRNRPALAAALCRNVVTRMKAPRFARRLEGLEKAAAAL
ncbi:MAG: phosphoadenosine phosphosulfate reductase [Pseudooceanicola sp.]